MCLHVIGCERGDVDYAFDLLCKRFFMSDVL